MGRHENALRQLADGIFIPAVPLALTGARKLDEQCERGLIRYYLESGAGGLAVAVHTTQFAIRRPEIGLFEPVLRLAAEEAERIGLVNRIDNEGSPLEIGKRYLEPYLKHSLCALFFAREAVQRGGRTGLEDGLRIERDLSTLAYRSDDAGRPAL